MELRYTGFADPDRSANDFHREAFDVDESADESHVAGRQPPNDLLRSVPLGGQFDRSQIGPRKRDFPGVAVIVRSREGGEVADAGEVPCRFSISHRFAVQEACLPGEVICITQKVEHGAGCPPHCEGDELHTASGIESLDRIQEADCALGREVVSVDRPPSARGKSRCDTPHRRHELCVDAISRRDVAGVAPAFQAIDQLALAHLPPSTCFGSNQTNGCVEFLI